MENVNVIVSGISYGRTANKKLSILVPEFSVKEPRRLHLASGYIDLPETSILDQQIKYIDDNYEDFIFKPVESEIYPVFGYKLAKIKLSKKEAKELKEIFSLVDSIFLEKSQQWKIDFTATLNEMWNVVKAMPVSKICEVVLTSMNVGYKIGINVLAELNKSFENIKEQNYLNESTS